MTTSYKLNIATTDASLPKSYPDAVMNAGTIMLFDFIRADSNPAENGLIPTDTVFADLAGGPNATLISAGPEDAKRITKNSGGGGITWPNQAFGNGDAISFGLTQRFYPNKPFVFGLWMKLATDGPTTNYTRFLFKGGGNTGSTANGSQIWMDTGVGGDSPRGQIGDGSTSYGGAATNDLSRAAVHHVAWSWLPGTEMRQFFDGEQVATFISGSVPATLLQNATDALILRMEGIKGTAYRLWAENTALSGRTAAQAVADEYALNSGRFT